METLTMYDGNGNKMVKELPKLVMLGYCNPTAIEHIYKQTGLIFKERNWKDSYEAQPTDSNQITRLFLTYNFKTRYYNNNDYKNTMFLKSDHHIGFDVDAICGKCREYNHVHSGDMKPEEMLAC